MIPVFRRDGLLRVNLHSFCLEVLLDGICVFSTSVAICVHCVVRTQATVAVRHRAWEGCSLSPRRCIRLIVACECRLRHLANTTSSDVHSCLPTMCVTYKCLVWRGVGIGWCGECRDCGVSVERAVFQIRSAVNGDQFHGVTEVSSETTKRVNFQF